MRKTYSIRFDGDEYIINIFEDGKKKIRLYQDLRGAHDTIDTLENEGYLPFECYDEIARLRQLFELCRYDKNQHHKTKETMNSFKKFQSL
jgi:hypothetical protein